MTGNMLGFGAMHSAHGEATRVATLACLDILDTLPEPAFDIIVECAQRQLGCKIALFSLVDEERQWFKSKRGLDPVQAPRQHGFCTHAVATDTILIVPDATRDARFQLNPLVTGAPHIRFYAGVPVRTASVDDASVLLPMGTLCVVDNEPRELGADDVRILRDLATVIEALLSARTMAMTATRTAEVRRLSFEKLERTHRQFRQAERMANIGSWRLTLDDHRTEWSEQTFAIHGLQAGAGPALENALDFYPPHARTLMSAAIARTIETGEPFTVETDLVTAQGDKRRIRSMGELEMKDGIAVALIGVFQDITNRHLMEEALRQTAYTDDLTRIASRGGFSRTVDEQINAAIEGGAPLALLLIDLDHFKSVNDQCGHAMGDELLRLMASKLQAPYLAGSFAARLGGDEFVLLITCPQALRDLDGLIRRLLAELRHSVSSDRASIPVSATIGACWLDEKVDNRSELLLRADTALYKAKQTQRGSAMISGQDQLITIAHANAPKVLRLVR